MTAIRDTGRQVATLAAFLIAFTIFALAVVGWRVDARPMIKCPPGCNPVPPACHCPDGFSLADGERICEPDW